jgi:hypothetical protein
VIAIVYDLRDPGAWHQAHAHRGMWGKLYTDVHTLDLDHIALVFRPGGERWRPWERERLRWILEEIDLAPEAA